MSKDEREGGVKASTWGWFTALMALCGVILLIGLGDVGVWEPWEASELSVAREYVSREAWDPETVRADPRASGYNWAVPTMGGEPVSYSLLKVWLVSASTPPQGASIEEVIGALERGARLPAALALWALCGALFWSVRRRFGDRAGWIAGVAFATLPVTYVGARSLATEQLFVVTTSLAALALFEFTRAEGKGRWGWSAVSALSLVLGFLDQRLIGLLVPAYGLGMYVAVDAMRGEDRGPRSLEWGLAAAAVFGPLIPLLGAATGGGEAAGVWLDVEHHAQLTFLGLGLGGVGALWVLGRRSEAARSFASAPGLLAWGVPLGVGAWVLHTYGAVNPTLLEGGEIVGEIPALAFALEHDLFGKSVASGHVHFDLWLRQVGFAMLPWAALAPAGIGYLAWLGREDGERGAYARLALCWAAAGLFVVAASSVWGHVFFPAYAPLAIGVALMLADGEWWARARREPFVIMAVGFSAVAIVMMLGKDVERYPHRFFELYVAMESKLEFPEGFSYGRSFKAMKYAWALALAAPVFGFGAWLVLNARRAFVELPAAFREEHEGEAGARLRLAAGWRAAWRVSGLGGETPMETQAELKQELREGEGRVGAALRWLEDPSRFGLWWSCLFAASAMVFAFVYLPRVGLHLSQRHVFETYLERAKSTETEPLYRHQTPKGEGALYLADVPELASTRAFMERFEKEERFFAVIPRDRLAALHYEARRKTDRDLPVVDASGSKLVLVSNVLGEGEVDQSPIGAAIMGDDLEIQRPVTFKGEGGEDEALTFDGKLEFLGYALDREGEGGELPRYTWGEEIEMTLYFRVKARVSGNQKLFVHVDTPGNRIHGDHYPVGGAFPTNYWPVGSVVADTHKIKVGSYAKQGEYSLNFGWFMGSKRMKAKPKSAHDGKNRVQIGKVRVAL